MTRGASYTASGAQFNGLSQANALGDQLEISTNHLLLRITKDSSLQVFHARTHDHSAMGVATGSASV